MSHVATDAANMGCNINVPVHVARKPQGNVQILHPFVQGIDRVLAVCPSPCYVHGPVVLIEPQRRSISLSETVLVRQARPSLQLDIHGWMAGGHVCDGLARHLQGDRLVRARHRWVLRK